MKDTFLIGNGIIEQALSEAKAGMYYDMMINFVPTIQPRIDFS